MLRRTVAQLPWDARLLVLLPFLFALGCDPVDQAAPGEEFCSAGASVLAVDDSEVPAAVKEKVYAPGAAIHTAHADYNDRGTLVVIPVAFPNYPANPSVTPSLIRSAFFSSGTGSVRDYFYEQSWGQFTLREGAVAPYVSLARTPEDYGGDEATGDFTRSNVVKKDILQGADIDWPDLDTNGDRTIEPSEALFLFLVPLGGGGANRGDVVTVPTQYGEYTVRNSFVWADSKRADDPTAGTATISYNYPIIWHEMAHALFGMPDRYGAFSGQGLTGEYDIMSDNFSKVGMNAFDAMRIGWIRPRILRAQSRDVRCYSFAAAETTPAALVLYNDEAPDDAWVVENRHKPSSPRGFDDDLPESGLAIWWADLSDASRRELRLIEASDPDERPTSYEDQSSGALFARTADAEGEGLVLLQSRAGLQGGMRLRGVSPLGPTMYAEF